MNVRVVVSPQHMACRKELAAALLRENRAKGYAQVAVLALREMMAGDANALVPAEVTDLLALLLGHEDEDVVAVEEDTLERLE